MSDNTNSSAENANDPLLAVIVPVLNEEDNVVPLIEEIVAALEAVCAYEIIYINDGSTDGTAAKLAEMRARYANLRVVEHSARAGQSTALRTGVLAARARLIATLDGDRQNDPADIPKLLEAWQEADRAGSGCVMITGHRVNRRDSWSKRQASGIANAFRRFALRDDNPDTGCSLKLYERELYLKLPFFDHMHRFLPALAQREGAEVRVVPVNHRERGSGQSKYTNFSRLLVGIPDLLGVMWLIRRAQGRVQSREVE